VGLERGVAEMGVMRVLVGWWLVVSGLGVVVVVVGGWGLGFA